MRKLKTTLFITLAFLMFGAIGMINVNAQDYDVWVNGERFTSDKTTIDCGDGTATYNDSAKTLTLDNAYINNGNISDRAYAYGILSEESITIKLIGSNVIEFEGIEEEGEFTATGIKIENDDLTINGSGSLLLDTEKFRHGIVAENVDITDSHVKIKSVNGYAGLYVLNEENWNGDVTLNNASLEIDVVGSVGYGISTDNLTLNNSNLYINLDNYYGYYYDDETGMNYYSGLNLSGNLTVNGDSNIDVKVKRNNSYETDDFYGISVSGKFIMNDGQMRVLAPEGVALDVGNIDESQINTDLKIKASNYVNDAYTYTKLIDLYDLEDNYYDYIKIGNFKTFSITNSAVQTTEMPANAYVGQYVTIYGYEYDMYELKDFKVIRVSDGKDVTNELNAAVYSYTHEVSFFMPDYDIEIIVDWEGNYTGQVYLYSAKLYGYDDVKISWYKSPKASGYYVYYKKSTSSSYTYLGSTTNTYYKKADLLDGVKYYFKVVPYKTRDGVKQKSPYYDTISIYTLKAPTNLYAHKYKNNTRNAEVGFYRIEGATGYTIYRYNAKSKTYKALISIKQTSVKDRSIVNYGLTKGKTYYYKVRAYKTVDGKRIYGPWSKTISYKVR